MVILIFNQFSYSNVILSINFPSLMLTFTNEFPNLILTFINQLSMLTFIHQFLKLQLNENFEKCPETNNQCKSSKYRFIINSEKKTGGGGYSVLVNYQSLLSNMFPLAPSIIFLYKI